MKLDLIEKQMAICEKFNSKFLMPDSNELIAIALNTLGDRPISGIHHIKQSGENVTWFIYCGEFSEQEDFFKPIHISHLIEYLPEVLPYLALEEGFRFVIDQVKYVSLVTPFPSRTNFQRG